MIDFDDDDDAIVTPLMATGSAEAGEFEGTTSCGEELGKPGDGKDIGGGIPMALVLRSYFFSRERECGSRVVHRIWCANLFQLLSRQFDQGYSSSSRLRSPH